MSSLHVPYIDLKRIVCRIDAAVLDDWKGCLERAEFVGGPTVSKLETRLAQELDAPHFVTCANGTDALTIGLQALGVKPGMKVAIPDLTFWATFESVISVGATPVLIDIDPDDLQMSLDELRRAHDELKLDAAVLVHVMGWASARLSEYRALCRERGILLLEDGAQAYGVKVGGESVFRGAELGTLSFYPAEVVGGAMDGGGVTARTQQTADLFRKLCNHGRSGHYSYSHVGWNSRMGGVQAAFLARVLDLADEMIESRCKALQLYKELLGSHPGVKLHLPPERVEGNGYLAVVTCAGRGGEELAKALGEAGIGCARTYPEPLHMQAPARGALRVSSLKQSAAFCTKVVNLPLFAWITEEECGAAAVALTEILKS